MTRAYIGIGSNIDKRFHIIKVLEELAHQTYVPASEESRLRGAGAGLTDND